MRVGRRQGGRQHEYHFTLGNLTPSENGCRVIAIDPGTAAARELCGSKRGDCRELESPHSVRRTDHCATPKKMATRTPIAAAQSNAMRNLRFTAKSC